MDEDCWQNIQVPVLIKVNEWFFVEIITDIKRCQHNILLKEKVNCVVTRPMKVYMLSDNRIIIELANRSILEEIWLLCCLLNQWFTKLYAVSDSMFQRKCCREQIFHWERILKGRFLRMKEMISIFVKLLWWGLLIFRFNYCIYEEIQAILKRNSCSCFGYLLAWRYHVVIYSLAK